MMRRLLAGSGIANTVFLAYQKSSQLKFATFIVNRRLSMVGMTRRTCPSQKIAYGRFRGLEDSRHVLVRA
jgi:hypothetical protein